MIAPMAIVEPKQYSISIRVMILSHSLQRLSGPLLLLLSPILIALDQDGHIQHLPDFIKQGFRGYFAFAVAGEAGQPDIHVPFANDAFPFPVAYFANLCFVFHDTGSFTLLLGAVA